MSSAVALTLPAGTSPLARLHAIRHEYGALERSEKLALIARFERHPPRSARALSAYHDDLLFLRAFPDDAGILAVAVRALGRMTSHVRALGVTQRHLLDDSGIAGSTTRHVFAYGIAQWLVAEGEEAELESAHMEAPERLDPLLRLTLTPAEADAFDSGELTTREWMAMARGAKHPALAWLVRPSANGAPRLSGAPDPAVIRLLYESLELPLRWRLTTRHATTGNTVDAHPLRARSAMRRLPADPVAHIALPLPGIERLAPERATVWISAARAALSARCREVHAITYANADEVYLADLGEGTTLCLIGAARDDRLTLEANYGYVLFSNGVPVGYGGVTPLANQANTGINIFDPFRHAEAPLLFAQALRAFHTVFGVTRFIVNPYQFGAGNDEALASGAYWLYDRLGFRSMSSSIRALADRERSRLAADRRHRSSLTTLRRLATGDIVLELPETATTAIFEERWLVTVARAVTESLVAADVPSRLARRDAAIDGVARALGIGDWAHGADGVRFGMARLAPVIALMLDDVSRWPEHERARLVALIAAKGGDQERDFAQMSRAHDMFWRALRRFCEARDARRAVAVSKRNSTARA